MTHVTSIMSLQSSVAFGHVGNSAAVFPMQRMGVEVLPVYTVLFSNSTAYGSWKGPVIGPDDLRAVIQGVDELDQLAHVDAILSGYQGGQETGQVIVDTVRLAKERNPQALYACDPVMGSHETGCFVAPGIPEFIRDHCIPVADIITPNHFELGFLTGMPTHTLAETLAAADALLERGPQVVVVTGVQHEDNPEDQLAMLAVTREGAWQVFTPRIDRVFNGAGDVTAATFLVHFLRTRDAGAAVGETAAIMHALLTVSAEATSEELALIEAQDVLVDPPQHFEVSKVR